MPYTDDDPDRHALKRNKLRLAVFAAYVHYCISEFPGETELVDHAAEFHAFVDSSLARYSHDGR